MRCYMCKKDLPVENFWKDKSRSRGYCGRCKECSRIYARKRVAKNREGYRKKAKRYYDNNEEKVKERNSKYYYDNRKKILAKQKVQYALYKGEIKRKPCEVCGEQSSDAHHPDYDKPLEVIWLCRQHHKLLHSKKRGA